MPRCCLDAPGEARAWKIYKNPTKSAEVGAGFRNKTGSIPPSKLLVSACNFVGSVPVNPDPAKKWAVFRPLNYWYQLVILQAMYQAMIDPGKNGQRSVLLTTVLCCRQCKQCTWGVPLLGKNGATADCVCKHATTSENKPSSEKNDLAAAGWAKPTWINVSR